MAAERKQFNVSVGENIARARRTAKLTQDELAEHIGMSKSFLAHVEKGDSSVSLVTLCSLAKVLQVSCDSLLPLSADTSDPHIKNVVHIMTHQTAYERETSEQVIRSLSRLCKNTSSQ